MVDTKNEDIVGKYFDLVQEEIKRLISEDKEIKPEQVETFNNEIFNQPEAIQGQMKQYVDKAAMNNLDIKKVAKVIYDKFKLQVKNNAFNQDDANDVPNPITERKFIKTFEEYREFSQDVKLKWKKEDLKKLYDQLREKLREAKNFLGDKTKGDELFQIDDIMKSLGEIEIDEARELINDIAIGIDMIKTFVEERMKEISRLN